MPTVITRALIGERGSQIQRRKCDDNNRVREKLEDDILLALKKEEGATSPELQVASRSWTMTKKRGAGGSSPRVSRRNALCQHLGLSPVRSILDF